jgi:hypothetical protein
VTQTQEVGLGIVVIGQFPSTIEVLEPGRCSSLFSRLSRLLTGLTPFLASGPVGFLVGRREWFELICGVVGLSLEKTDDMNPTLR